MSETKHRNVFYKSTACEDSPAHESTPSVLYVGHCLLLLLKDRKINVTAASYTTIHTNNHHDASLPACHLLPCLLQIEYPALRHSFSHYS
ncbi:hypothetical protein GDO81_017942 [Engystomops pustulosus]|uniref:Uncharacterized protein n=1 Tax=Engystomops pustulosus TaxID=76066 RepID=A0AAV7AAU0_ENGPU|nr:hypothetical protein GDO81_017942 [Engystomops pustulosus]